MLLLAHRSKTAQGKHKMKDYGLSIYEREMLSAMYKSLDYMICNDLPCSEIEKAIISIEAKATKETN